MSLKRQLLDNVRGLAAMAFIAVVALLAAGYILHKERVQSPFADRYEVHAAFTAAAGLTPGAGQPVNVAGVQVGQVGDVVLRDGTAIVTFDMDRHKLPHVFADARATLVPRTPLKDLQVELFPGRRRDRTLSAKDTIPVAQTASPIDADELLAALDNDTRQYLRILLADSGRAIDHRGPDLRRVIANLRPTATQLASMNRALRERRGALRGLVHELSIIAGAAGAKDTELARLVSAGDATLSALAAEQGSLRTSVRDLPGTLAATQASLRKVEVFTAELQPALTALRAPAKRIVPALRSLDPVTREAPGILRTKLRPLVREARPLVRDLRPAATSLTAATPNLGSVVNTLTYTVNELAYNPAGDDEGYLFWLAWFAHNGASFLSTQDANGPAWRGLTLVSCDTAGGLPSLGPLLIALVGQAPTCNG